MSLLDKTSNLSITANYTRAQSNGGAITEYNVAPRLEYNYQSSLLGIVSQHQVEPSHGTATFGFYSEEAGQTADVIINADSRLHNEYSLNWNPLWIHVNAYNPLAENGIPFYDTSLDPLDGWAPKNNNSANYNTETRYVEFGPSEGRY